MGEEENETRHNQKIVIQQDGPYVVQGNIELVRKKQVVSKYGEPLTWEKTGEIKTEEGEYCLCRCGQSEEKPFCDGSHGLAGFDGTETADSRVTAERQVVLVHDKNFIVKRDYSLCSEAGFCGNRFTDIEKMVVEIEDTQIRAQIIAMIERCPSGSYVYSMGENGKEIEPDLPRQIAVITEMTRDGPIMGPLWVTGNILIEQSDRRTLEIRNRVTLCRCGLSKIKPLCDGTHRRMGIKE